MRSPESELDVVFLIGRHWEQLQAETPLTSISFHDGALDATGIYNGEEVYIEVEVDSSNFFDHGHDPARCDVVICYRHNRDIPEQMEYVEQLKDKHGEDDSRYKAAKNVVDMEENTFEDTNIKVLELNDIIG